MSTADGRPDAEELAGLALHAARAAAELVRDRRTRGVTVAATKSSDVDVVTEADRASEELIRRTIRERRPDDAFLGEEGDDEAGTSGVRWIIDPIDGTVNFLYGLPQYAVSVAAEVDGEVVTGVVLNAATGTTYLAVRRADGVLVATRDGERIAANPDVPLDKMLVGTGFSYDREVRRVQVTALLDLLPRVRDVRRLGSCALDLCHVAEGSLDAYVEEGVNLWDHAAGGLIARAAGARTELLPGAGGLSLLLCAPASAFEEFRGAVLRAGFADRHGE
ncbi:inositol monophosphatase family protein [Nocardioides dongkuii]|uniref:inositol monophosphatase family protein n=1 Tax=Nocardioides dongkuii TaxID=2760089 RepID=UPI0015F7CDA4|nr:inositol monophosphatase family protein [Nocardioides dongkuii]